MDEITSKLKDIDVEKVTKKAKELLKNPENQAALAGAVVAYLLSDENKERNAVVGGAIGFFAAKTIKKNKEVKVNKNA